MRAKRMSQVRLSVCCEAQCAHACPVATWPTINPTAWQTAALGVEGSAALKCRQQRPMTGPEMLAGAAPAGARPLMGVSRILGGPG